MNCPGCDYPNPNYRGRYTPGKKCGGVDLLKEAK